MHVTAGGLDVEMQSDHMSMKRLTVACSDGAVGSRQKQDCLGDPVRSSSTFLQLAF